MKDINLYTDDEVQNIYIPDGAIENRKTMYEVKTDEEAIQKIIEEHEIRLGKKIKVKEWKALPSVL